MRQFFLLLGIFVFSLNAVKQRSESDVVESKRVQLKRYESLRPFDWHRRRVIGDLKRSIQQYEQREQRQRMLRDLRAPLQKLDSDSDSSSSDSISIDSEYEWENGYGPEIYKANYPPSDSESSSSEGETYFYPEDCCNVL